MPGLNSAEIIRALERDMGMNRARIQSEGGPSPRLQQEILRNPHRTHSYTKGLVRIACENLNLPWSEDWSFQVAQLRSVAERYSNAKRSTQEVEREFGNWVRAVKPVLERIMLDPAERHRFFPEVQDFTGILFFVGLYELIRCRSCEDKEATRISAKNCFTEFLRVVPKKRDSLAVDLLRFKAAANIVVVEWNAVPKSQRMQNDALLNKLDKLQYFEKLLAYSELFPNDEIYPLNALALASAACMREQYADLHKCLISADPSFKNFEAKAYDDHFDSDFDDFRAWLKGEVK